MSLEDYDIDASPAAQHSAPIISEISETSAAQQMRHDSLLDRTAPDSSIDATVDMSRSLSGVEDTGADTQTIYARLISHALNYLTPAQVGMLKRAYEFASDCHFGQVRKSGEPFIDHPLEVARILCDLRMDTDTLVAAILHDTVEDSSATLEDVERIFGPGVAGLVDGVTKISKVEVGSLSEEQASTLRHMLVAMSKDIRVIVIKLADRLHNMRTLMALREDRRIFKARETMEIYAPLAHRLGMSSIKWELEDLSFFYLEPAKYQQVAKMVAESRQAREKYLEDCINEIRAELDKLHLKATITGRPKHLYSIYQKMTNKGKGFSEIYDLIALRVIVETVKDCYSALGAVHTLWHPMPGRFKDYIAMPKFNMYQSLHTTVIGPAARPLEVQIRTYEMHRMSEYGVAAHWRYKENGKGDDYDVKLSWLRELLDWQNEEADPREFMEDLKTDLFSSEVFVFTPKGEVKSLRAGATPIDFAYAIHTEVGHHCVGAKVNGVIVPITYELQNGDRCEIITQKNSHPSRDWLAIAKTPSARSKIRSYFTKASRGDDMLRGRELLGEEMRKHGAGLSAPKANKALAEVADELGFPTSDDLLAHVGTNKISPKLVSNRLLRQILQDGQTQPAVPKTLADFDFTTAAAAKQGNKPKQTDSGVVVKGIDEVLVHFAHCCNPVPGDEIVGFVTRGRGVSVHRKDCPNAQKLMENPERCIEVNWEGNGKSSYQVEVIVEAVDRLRLLQDVTIKLADMGVNILSAQTQVQKDGINIMRFLFEMTETARIDQVLNNLRSVEGVFDAHRMIAGEYTTKTGKKSKR